MISQEVMDKMKIALDTIAKNYGDLSIKIEVLKVKKGKVTLKVGAVDKNGNFIVTFGEMIGLMEGDTVNVNFKKPFNLLDFVYLTL